MHVLGKTLVILLILAGLGSVYFASKLHNRRQEWMSQIVALKNEREANMDQLRKDRNTQAVVEAALNRQMENWGNQWEAPNSGPFPGQPGIQLGIGGAQGLGSKEVNLNKPLPNIFVFAPAEDGSSSRYLGEFKLEQLQPNQAGALLTRQPYPGEVESWPVGVYRIWQFIPSNWKSTFIDLNVKQTMADENVIDETAKLDIQDKHIAESQEALDRRLAELNGNAAAAANASDVVKRGLVESIRQEEAERNTLLQSVDELRRTLSDNYAKLTQVLAENQQLVEAMPDGTPDQTASRSGASAASPSR